MNKQVVLKSLNYTYAYKSHSPRREASRMATDALVVRRQQILVTCDADFQEPK